MSISKQKYLFLFFLIASTVLHLGVLLFDKSQRHINLNAAPLLVDAPVSMKINIRKSIQQQQIKKKPKIIKYKVKKEKAKNKVKKEKDSKKSIVSAPQTTTKNFDTLINNYTQPSYPRLAIRRGLTGIVKLTLWINSNGHIDEVELTKSSGHKSLDESALNAVKEWRFKKISTQLEQTALYKVEKRIIYQLD